MSRLAMRSASPQLIDRLDQHAGRLVHAGWLIVMAVAAITLSGALGLAGYALAAIAALPGALGLLLAGPHRGRTDAVRLTLALAWTLPGVVAVAAFATALSPAALVFMTGPAAMAAGGARDDVRLSATLNAFAFILMAGAAVLGPIGSGAPSLVAAAGPWLALAGFFAVAAFMARARLAWRLDAAEAELDQRRAAAEGFDHAPTPLLALDSAGRITAASRSLRRLTPGAPRSLAGLPADGLAFDDDQAGAVRAGLISAQDGGGADGGAFTFSVRAADGAEAALDARAVATPTGFVLALEREQAAAGDPVAQTQLAAERDAAIAANRSKSEFLAAVSHELRTPLNAIIGFSDIIKQRLFGPLPARYAEYGDLIHESGEHLLELIGDVLDMSKIEADRYELDLDQFDARDVVEICAKMIRPRAEENGLALYCETGDGDLAVEADRKAVRQILLNLLSNAVKFTPEGGAIVVMSRAEGEDLVLAVGDSGVGIAPEELDRIGQPYAQTQSGRATSERGTGLGLTLVRALARLHGGDMTVQSAPGEGTTVTVRLPVMSDPTGQVSDFAPLEVHQRILAAQKASEQIARA